MRITIVVCCVVACLLSHASRGDRYQDGADGADGADEADDADDADDADGAADAETPNIIIVFTDDHGYADVGVFGARGFVTP